MTRHTERPVLFGAPYSVYVQAARLALDEKSVEYELVPIDIFTEAGPSAEHLARQPFGKIPAFEHAGFRLYEAGAITRYVDEAFPGAPLQPAEPQARARMNQIISIADSYAYRTLVWDIYVERVSRPASGLVPDEAKIAAALAAGRGLPRSTGGVDRRGALARRIGADPRRSPYRPDVRPVPAGPGRAAASRPTSPARRVVGADQHAAELRADSVATTEDGAASAVNQS
jgi:hypothetical protein